MIDFQRLNIADKAHYDEILMNCGQRGCEYTFVNLFLWGRQKAAFQNGRLLVQSQFDRKCVYPFPMGDGDLKTALDAIIADARERGIPCRISGIKSMNDYCPVPVIDMEFDRIIQKINGYSAGFDFAWDEDGLYTTP